MASKLYPSIFISALVSSVLSIGIFSYLSSGEAKKTASQNYAQQVNLNRLDKLLHSDRLSNRSPINHPLDFVNASEITTPAVVYIQSGGGINDEVFEENKAVSSGSGVIISPNGYIVTNYHVIENGTNIQVLLNDNREFTAKIVGIDPSTDLALLKIEEEALPFLIFGNSDSVQVGEWVLAVGNPFRLQSTVTAGIVSAKARNIHILNSRQYSIESFIQTDAVVNPGNSGGALVNTAGELVGINTAIMTYTGRYEGYSFSIPSNLVRKVISDIKEFGSVQRGLLGVVIQNVNNDIAKSKGLDKITGVIINSVSNGGAADDAGLVADDIILKINNKTVNSVPELQELIGQYRPGQTVDVEYFRDGDSKKISVTLKNQINSTELIATRRDKILSELGFELRDLTEIEKNNLHIEGIKVLSILENSLIAETNMAPDFIITRFNKTRIKTVNQLIQLLEKTKGDVLLEGIYEKYSGKFPYRFTLK